MPAVRVPLPVSVPLEMEKVPTESELDCRSSVPPPTMTADESARRLPPATTTPPVVTVTVAEPTLPLRVAVPEPVFVKLPVPLTAASDVLPLPVTVRPLPAVSSVPEKVSATPPAVDVREAGAVSVTLAEIAWP